ncbi:hypothetical protein LOK49_LG04G00393 [Camellia lanceoleosa]|uniref:Uncharacterized protein n=1 Tax=Camellia lanceoleosa TaxID=1840588 RepID=A0ACC0HUW9_9ERIC|nr:hypothetical protein LOK49_LG04G00393 [Camellia lanceoleosa]
MTRPPCLPTHLHRKHPTAANALPQPIQEKYSQAICFFQCHRCIPCMEAIEHCLTMQSVMTRKPLIVLHIVKKYMGIGMAVGMGIGVAMGMIMWITLRNLGV